MTARVVHADCLDALRELDDASVSAVITDPPYGLSNTDPAHVVETLTRWAAGERDYVPTGRGFMGKPWDAFVPPPAVWDECYRVLKPGGHLLAFAGSRTFDLMTLSVRFAGFDIRDSIAWLYGSGFPKSLDVAKAITTKGGRPEDIRRAAMGDAYVPSGRGRVNYDNGGGSQMNGSTQPLALSDGARAWQGWGTALKPAFEPIVVARKPLSGTVAANVLTHGTGALNIDATRVGDGSDSQGARSSEEASSESRYTEQGGTNFAATPGPRGGSPAGRWPTNVVLDGHAADALDEQSGTLTSGGGDRGTSSRNGLMGADSDRGRATRYVRDSDSGGASRFFPTFRYQAKTPARERPSYTREDGTRVAHPTVKPVELMRWLVRLVTPPGGVILDPFAGSGATVEAALAEGFDVVAVEREFDYLPLIAQRVDRVKRRGQLW